MFDQGGFTGTVVSHEGKKFPLADLQAYIFEYGCILGIPKCQFPDVKQWIDF